MITREGVSLTLKYYRIWSDISQSKMAELTDVTQATLSRIETSQSDVKLVYLARFAEVLKIPLLELISRIEEDSKLCQREGKNMDPPK